jgi:hypothetical protein
MLSAPFSDMLHSHYAITMPFCQLAMHLVEETCFAYENWMTLEETCFAHEN